MPRLGEILVEMGACDAASVRAALESQVLLGGRLGTNLLEIGDAVTEEVLARALQRQHGVLALYGDLRPEAQALALLRPEFADRLEVIPYRLAGRRLSVLCCAPRALAKLDEVAFATGKWIDPIVVPEARLWALLRAHYGIERQLRGIEVEWASRKRSVVSEAKHRVSADLIDEAHFQRLYDGGSNLRPDGRRDQPAAPPRGRASWPPPLGPAPRVAVRKETAERPDDPFLTTEEVLAQLQTEASGARRAHDHPARVPTPPTTERAADPRPGVPAAVPPSPAPVQPPAPPPRVAEGSRPQPPQANPPAPIPSPTTPLSYSQAVAALAGVTDRDSIARVVLRYASSHFRRAVLLAVHGTHAQGWEGMGEGITPQHVARVHVPLDAPSVVRTVVESRSHFLGPLARTEANIALLRALAGGAPRNAFAMPILAKGRVVNVLYADAGRSGFVDPDAVGELLILATKISQVYEALLAQARAR